MFLYRERERKTKEISRKRLDAFRPSLKYPLLLLLCNWFFCRWFFMEQCLPNKRFFQCNANERHIRIASTLPSSSSFTSASLLQLLSHKTMIPVRLFFSFLYTQSQGWWWGVSAWSSGCHWCNPIVALWQSLSSVSCSKTFHHVLFFVYDNISTCTALSYATRWLTDGRTGQTSS